MPQTCYSISSNKATSQINITLWSISYSKIRFLFCNYFYFFQLITTDVGIFTPSKLLNSKIMTCYLKPFLNSESFY